MLQQHPLFSHLFTVFLHTVTCGSFRLCSLLANSLLALFTVSHTVPLGSICLSQSSCAWVLQQHPLSSCLFAVILHTVACGSFRFCNLLAHSRPLAVFASVIASHTVAPDSFRCSQSYTRLLLAAFVFAVFLYMGASATSTLLPFCSRPTYSCSWQLSLLQPSSTQPLFSSIRLRHRLTHSCPSQLSLFTVFSHMVAPGSIYSSQSSCAGVLQQHSLFSRLFPVVLHTAICGNFRFCNLLAQQLPFDSIRLRHRLAHSCPW